MIKPDMYFKNVKNLNLKNKYYKTEANAPTIFTDSYSFIITEEALLTKNDSGDMARDTGETLIKIHEYMETNSKLIDDSLTYKKIKEMKQNNQNIYISENDEFKRGIGIDRLTRLIRVLSAEKLKYEIRQLEGNKNYFIKLSRPGTTAYLLGIAEVV